MTYRFKSEEDAQKTAHHLRSAAIHYDEIVKQIHDGAEGEHLIEAFKRQAVEARRLADEIAEEEG